jgi:hypothetical protein
MAPSLRYPSLYERFREADKRLKARKVERSYGLESLIPLGADERAAVHAIETQAILNAYLPVPLVQQVRAGSVRLEDIPQALYSRAEEIATDFDRSRVSFRRFNPESDLLVPKVREQTDAFDELLPPLTEYYQRGLVQTGVYKSFCTLIREKNDIATGGAALGALVGTGIIRMFSPPLSMMGYYFIAASMFATGLVVMNIPANLIGTADSNVRAPTRWIKDDLAYLTKKILDPTFIPA